MRSIKTHGGLTRGKRMTENQRLVWVLSLPVCASINETMQMFSGVSYETSDQQKVVSAGRQARDVSDTVDLIGYLNERDPFVQNDSLFNIANGMTAQEIVNVEKARENQNQNRFIRSYYRPRRPLLRPYLVAVAEATWKKVYMNVCM